MSNLIFYHMKFIFPQKIFNNLYSISDTTSDYELNAILSIIRTLFVSVVLGVGKYLFLKVFRGHVIF